MKILLLLTLGALAAYAASADTYCGMFWKGKKIGYAVLSETDTEIDSRAAHKVEWRQVIAGSTIESATGYDYDIATWMDADLNPLKEVSVEKSAGHTVTVTSTFAGRNIHVVRENSGTKVEKDLELQPGQAYETDAIKQLMTVGVVEGKSIDLYTVDTDSLVLDKTTYTYRGKTRKVLLGETRDLFRIEVALQKQDSDILFESGPTFVSGSGIYDSQLIRMPRERALARDIDPKLDIYEQGRLIPDKKIRHVQSLDELKLLLAWPKAQKVEIPSDDQQTAALTAEGWVIDIHPHPLDLDDNATISQAQKDKAEWLKPDIYVPSDSPHFISLAATIVGKETRVSRVVLRIKDFVNRTMHYREGIEIWRDASEILKSKEGVCRDYSILTLTLLRAAGVPSKFACGFVNWDGDFYDHEWVLAWDSKSWIGVDAMTPDEQLSAAHLELVSGTFDQTLTSPDLLDAKLSVVQSHVASNLGANRRYERVTDVQVGFGELSPAARAAGIRGEALKKAGKLAEAEICFREAARLDPDSATPANALGNSLLLRRQWQAAIDVYSASLAHWPKNYGLLQNRAYCLLSLGRYLDSELDLIEAHRYDPDERRYAPLLGYVLYKQGKYQDSAFEYRRAVAADPKDSQSLEALVECLNKMPDSEEAEIEGTRLLARQPTVSSAYFALGEAQYINGHFAAAAQTYRKLIALEKSKKPLDGRALAYGHGALSMALLQLKRKPEAIAEARKAIRLGLKDHPVYKMLGIHP